MSASPDAPLHGDLSRRVAIDTDCMDWSASPSPCVLRKRLHRVGPAESGQVTSLVRFEPGATFPAHGHPEGEEILVLEGVFSDEHGDWAAGSYLLNPEGFRHAPCSREGCLLFVKLRQAAGTREHVALRTDRARWTRGRWPGSERLALHVPAGFPDHTWLERWAAGTAPGEVAYPEGAEILVLEGALADEHGQHGPRSWLRLPAGSVHHPSSAAGCTFYVKYAGLPGLRTAR
jgi:anti-sigma factor ChrR (cupin superfamily)